MKISFFQNSISSQENSADSDQLASSEVSWSGSTLLFIITIHINNEMYNCTEWDWDVTHAKILKPVTHQSAAVHLSMTTNFWVSCGSSTVVPNTCLAATTKTKFSTCSFSLRYTCNLMQDCRKAHRAASKLLQDFRTTNLRAYTHVICLQMPQVCHVINVQWPCALLHDCRRNAL